MQAPAPTPAIPAQSVYAERRAQVARQLGEGGIAIIPTAPEHPRNRDSDFLFRHDSYFYYLTGFSEPNAWLVLTGEGAEDLIFGDEHNDKWQIALRAQGIDPSLLSAAAGRA